MGVDVLPPLPKAEMRTALAAADVCLAILKPIEMYKTVYPNKVFDYMAESLGRLADRARGGDEYGESRSGCQRIKKNAGISGERLTGQIMTGWAGWRI